MAAIQKKLREYGKMYNLNNSMAYILKSSFKTDVSTKLDTWLNDKLILNIFENIEKLEESHFFSQSLDTIINFIVNKGLEESKEDLKEIFSMKDGRFINVEIILKLANPHSFIDILNEEAVKQPVQTSTMKSPKSPPKQQSLSTEPDETEPKKPEKPKRTKPKITSIKTPTIVAPLVPDPVNVNGSCEIDPSEITDETSTGSISTVPTTATMPTKIRASYKKGLSFKSLEVGSVLNITNEKLDYTLYKDSYLDAICNEHAAILIIDIESCKEIIYPITIDLYPGSTNRDVIGYITKAINEASLKLPSCHTTLASYTVKEWVKEARYIYIKV